MFERGELAHAEPSWRRALKVLAIWLPIWLGPVALLWALTGSASVWTQLGGFLQHHGGRHLRRRLRGARLCRASGRRRFWLARPRRNGRRARPCRDDARAAHPGAAVRRLPRRLSRAPARSIPLLAGFLGALLTTWVTFAPCFLWIFLGGPYVEALRGNKAISAALSAITAAVVGVILNLALWFALHVVFGEVRSVRAFWRRPGSADPDLARLASGAARGGGDDRHAALQGRACCRRSPPARSREFCSAICRLGSSPRRTPKAPVAC